MNFQMQYFAACVPSLLDSELEILKDEVLSLHHPDDVSPHLVIETARQMFPEVVNRAEAREKAKASPNVYDRLRLQEAVNDLSSTVDRLSKVSQSDAIAQVRLSLMEAADILRGEVKQ